MVKVKSYDGWLTIFLKVLELIAKGLIQNVEARDNLIVRHPKYYKMYLDEQEKVSNLNKE
jgi:hypothetical protein